MSAAAPARAGADAIEIFAPAKINLYLHVVGRRDDGYHLLDSLVVFAGIGDTLSVSPGNELRLEITGPHAAPLAQGNDNLVIRAARKLAQAAGIAPDAQIRLTKRLPVASGIGGGSADAAAALRGLVRLWRLDFGDRELAALGLALGADVPACLRGRASLVSGIGEIIEPAPLLPPAWLVLVNPGVTVSTRDVFARRASEFARALPLAYAPRDVADLAAQLAARRNDLAASATGVAPIIETVLQTIGTSAGCLLARMSGSGATCFGLFGNKEAAQSCARAIAAAHSGWWCVAAPMLS